MSEEDKNKESTEEAKEEVKEKPSSQDTSEKVPEKISLTKQELDNQLANARRKAEADYKALKSDYEDFKKSIEAKEKAANDAAAEKVEALRKDLPESVTKLLDKLSAVEQLEWLIDPENVIVKKEIPPLPQSANEHGKIRKTINIV
jgi:molecular chaperone GrpE (heat shock protein)